MQAERVRTRDGATPSGGLNQLCKPLATCLERPRELALFRLDAGQDLATTLLQVWIGRPHDVDDHAARLRQERALDAHQPPVPHRATHDPAQDVAGALVRRAYSLPDQEGHRA